MDGEKPTKCFNPNTGEFVALMPDGTCPPGTQPVFSAPGETSCTYCGLLIFLFAVAVFVAIRREE